MLRKEFLRKEISSRLSNRLGFVLTVGLAAGLLLSLSVIWLFAQIADEVVEGETSRFDEMVLLWIYENSPGWFEAPMLFATALGEYWVVLPLLALAAFALYRMERRISAMLLLVSTLGGAVLNAGLKSVFQRTRPELFDIGYDASSFYSFPSTHATVAVGFYGTLALLLAWHMEGFRRWAVAVAGTILVLLIGFSRLYLGVHYPTDVLAGFLAAPLWVGTIGLAFFLYRFVRGNRKRRVGRWRRKQP